MLGGIVFVIIVWFVPLIIWIIIQNPFKQNSSCEFGKKEIFKDRKMFLYALGFGIFILILIILFG